MSKKKDPLASLKVAAPEGEAPESDLQPGEGLFDAELAPAADASQDASSSDEEGGGGRGASSDAPHEEPPLPATPPPAPEPRFEVLESRKVSWGPQTINLRQGQIIRFSRYGGQPGIDKLEAAGVKLKKLAD